MFMAIYESIQTDEYNKFRCNIVPADSINETRINISFGAMNSMLLNLREVRDLLTSLQDSLLTATKEQS